MRKEGIQLRHIRMIYHNITAWTNLPLIKTCVSLKEGRFLQIKGRHEITPSQGRTWCSEECPWCYITNQNLMH